MYFHMGMGIKVILEYTQVIRMLYLPNRMLCKAWILVACAKRKLALYRGLLGFFPPKKGVAGGVWAPVILKQ